MGTFDLKNLTFPVSFPKLPDNKNMKKISVKPTFLLNIFFKYCKCCRWLCVWC